MRLVNVVLPHDIDDPATPSGGNTYDRRVCAGLTAAGWSLREHVVPGAWPRPTATERAGLARLLAGLDDDAVVLLDGLVASAVPQVLVPAARRLRLVVLVHMPLCDDAEGAALAAATSIVATSEWTRRQLLDRYALPAQRVHVATPGVDPAPLATGSAGGAELLCVAAVTAGKGHDVLMEALAAAADLPWRCVCVGALTRDPEFVDRLRRRAHAAGVAGRVSLVGPRTGDGLAAAYAGADLLVLASRAETYGMVVTEALARGIPVLASDVDGLPEALGRAPDGSRPGLLVQPGDPGALAGALRRWLGDAELRRRLRRSAHGRRATLTGWDVTAARVAGALTAAVAA
ncbi:Glycosyltransferase Family 4 [Micromonospora pattaloongensis]|uniref:Glycosyltransferase Family 4 n=1 Tax=Micromonospora pattaloongensis TaxID=405436 RepID=A0A1H3JJF2_9ACTN|nr:glycosyltransferase family 4 protein [Micromonospora pattaloongensis]SDY40007.1 Glycosyltransferase Family 4 [Micromonospora pattaloongensis]